MQNIDELFGMTVPLVLRFHGLQPNQCPIDPNHELTVASNTYAVCHSCGIEWDNYELHLDLISMAKPNEEPTASYDAENMLTTHDSIVVPTTRALQDVEDAVDITLDFVRWVRANLQHIARTPHYDRDHANAIGFVTLKGNLCLLPCVTDSLTLTQIRLLEEEWKRTNVIYPPSTGRGIKRPERVPFEIRRAHRYSSTTKVYTFHRRETAIMLHSETEHPSSHSTVSLKSVET